MGTTSTIHVATTAILRVSGLQDQTGSYDNAGTVTLEDLVDYVTGDQVTGITYPLSIPYVVASNGDYEVNLPATLGVVANRAYVATIKAVGAGGDEKQWKETIRCRDAVV